MARTRLVAALVILLAVVLSSWWLIHRKRAAAQAAILASEAQPPNLSLCQLVSDASRYEGWMVRVQAVYSRSVHGSELSDNHCSDGGDTVWVVMSDAVRSQIADATDTAYGLKHVSGPIRISALGRFTNNNPSGGGDSFEATAPFRFELLSFENAVRADKL